MIKNLIFDLGGVIIDVDVRNAMKRFAALGLEHPERFLDPYHQSGIFNDVEDGKIDAATFVDELGRLIGRRPDPAAVARAWHGFAVGLSIAKLRYLDDLRRRGYKLYLLSNTNPFMMMWADSPAFSPELRPLSSYFDGMFLSYRMKCSKPGEEIFSRLIAETGINPAETLFVDDSQANVDAGLRHGLRVFKPQNGADWRPDVEALLNDRD